jgi:hypothetical protein
MPLEWDYPVFKRIMGRIRAFGQPSQLPPITMPLRRRRVKMAMRTNPSYMYTSQRLERPRRMYASQKRQAVRRSPKEEFINELPCKDSEGITEEDLDMMWKYASHIANALGINVDEIDKTWCVNGSGTLRGHSLVRLHPNTWKHSSRVKRKPSPH